MFWFLFLTILYLGSLAITLAFVYSAGVLNSRADRLTEELFASLDNDYWREAA